MLTLCVFWILWFKHYFRPKVIFWQLLYSDLRSSWTNFRSKIFHEFFCQKCSTQIIFWTNRCFTQIFFDQKVLIYKENCCDRFKYLRYIVYFLFIIRYDTKIGFWNFLRNHVLNIFDFCMKVESNRGHYLIMMSYLWKSYSND